MIKRKLSNENLSLKESVYKRITNPFYLIAVAITALGTYGFYLANPSPSIDWLSYDRYYGGILFSQGRFTATIVEKALNLWDCPVWFEPLLGIICFILGTLIMLAIFDGFCEQKSIVPSIIFTCIYISFPLLPEYFIYNGAILTVGGCTVLLSLALYFSIKYSDMLHSFFLPIILMMFVFSWYECMILPYVGIVFAVFILKDHKEKGIKTGEVIVKGLYHAVVLGLAVLAEAVITKVIIKIFSIKLNDYAKTESFWTASIKAVKYLIRSYISYWGLKFFCNPAFTILLAAGIVAFILFIINIKRTKKFSSVILFLGSLIPVFAMTLYRGGGAEYRTEQGMPFFVAFTAFLLCLNIQSGKVLVKRAFAAIFVFALIIQIGASNKCYWINNQRYEEEKNVILTINSRLTENCDMSKPVIFIGEYTVSESLQDKITVSDSSFVGKIVHRFGSPKNYATAKKIYDYIGSSYLTWSIESSFNNSRPEEELYKFCDYIGVSFKHCTGEQYNEANKKYSKIKAYPNKDCIVETDEYIVVKL